MSVHKAKLQQGLSVPLDRGYKRAFNEGKASRDAEVAGLNAKLTETEKVLEMTTKGIELQNQTLSFLSNKLTESQRLNKVALEAIRLAVRQNSCEMVMTGDEIRKCESAIKKIEGALK